MMTRPILLASTFALLIVAGIGALAEAPDELPEPARAIIPDDFTFNPELTALLQAAEDDSAEVVDKALEGAPVTTRWWAFSHPGSVDDAFDALSIPDGAQGIEPMTVTLAEALTSYRDNLGDEALAALWGPGWAQRADGRVAEWENAEQRLAAAALWQAGDMLNPRDDPTETVTVTAMLDGRNVSADSAGVVLESEEGPFVAALVPDADGETLVGRLLPGRYELFVIWEADGRQAFSMDTTTINVMPGTGASANVTVEAWDFPMRMPWSMDDLSEADPVTGVEPTADVSFLSIYLVNPWLNPAELELVEGTHLLVSCVVHGEYEL